MPVLILNLLLLAIHSAHYLPGDFWLIYLLFNVAYCHCYALLPNAFHCYCSFCHCCMLLMQWSLLGTVLMMMPPPLWLANIVTIAPVDCYFLFFLFAGFAQMPMLNTTSDCLLAGPGTHHCQSIIDLKIFKCFCYHHFALLSNLASTSVATCFPASWSCF